MDSITESRMETASSSLSNYKNSQDIGIEASSENLSCIFKGIMKNGHGSRAIFREINFIDDEQFEDDGLSYR